MTVINSSTQYYIRRNSFHDEPSVGKTTYEFYVFKDSDSFSSPYTLVRLVFDGSTNDYRVVSDSLGFNQSPEDLFTYLTSLYNQIKNKSLMTHQVGYVYDLYTEYFVDYFYGNNPAENTSQTSTYGFFTGDLVVSPPLDMTNKRAYLANFPVQFADDDDYKQCMLDFLNIIGSCLYNLYFKQNIYKSDVVLDNSSIVDVLSTIGEILHDKEFTQPILINQNNTENYASLENEDWNLE